MLSMSSYLISQNKHMIHNTCAGFAGNKCQNMLPRPEIYRCKQCFHEFNMAYPSPLELD